MDFGLFDDLLKKDAFGANPSTILNPQERDIFGLVMEVLLVETSGHASWANWQRGQLNTLVEQISRRSKFHANRLAAFRTGKKQLSEIPVQTRQDTIEQVKTEGALIRPADRLPTSLRSTTGSSGTPIKLYSTPINAKYISIRNLANEFQRNHDFRLNFVRIPLNPKVGDPSAVLEMGSVSNQQRPLWNMFSMGSQRFIRYQNCIERLIDELKKRPVHRIATHPSTMDEILAFGGAEILRELGIRIWIPYSGHRDFSKDHLFNDVGIDIQGTYSSEEFGPIAYECNKCAGHFHVATSNVIVEADESVTAEFSGNRLSRILITGLHAYATPFIRYDIGDMGQLLDRCPCGHDGPILKHIFGRAKQFFVTSDDRLVPFYVTTPLIMDTVECTEFQFHQKDKHTVVARIGGRDTLGDDEIKRVEQMVWNVSGEKFDVQVIACPQIDWSGNTKKLGVTSAVNPEMSF